MRFYKESEWEHRQKPHTELPPELDKKRNSKQLIIGLGVVAGVVTLINLLAGRK